MKTIIFHFHLFKNAGTSLDALLQSNFPGRWVTREFSVPPTAMAVQVRDWIKKNADAVCFSSHTARLPAPEIPGIKVFPVLFLRHPLDRVQSVYSFERRQNSPNFGSVLARNTTLRGYIESRLALPNDRQLRNFQASRLSTMYPLSEGSELQRASRALEELPFVGVVDRFEESVRLLERKLKEEGFGHLSMQNTVHNSSGSAPRPVEQTVAELAEEIGDETMRALTEANQDDLEIYKRAVQNIDRKTP